MFIKRMVKDTIPRIGRNSLSRALVNYHVHLCRENNINPDLEVKGEKEWIEKWGGILVRPSPVYYRLFSHYCGRDSRIVPEDICSIAVEEVLNPSRFRKYYADKNIWDKIFPEEYTPETILRCMSGFFYDKDYNRLLNLSDKDFQAILKRRGLNSYIIKPTRDSNSGEGFHVLKLYDGKFCFNGNPGQVVTIKKLKKYDGDNWIIQPFLKQNKTINLFCKTSVSPIRITTYKSVADDSVHVLDGGVIRIGYNGENNDGTHGNGRFVGIERNGKLKNMALNFRGHKIDSFNGVNFKEFHEISSYDKVCQLAQEVAKRVTHCRLLAFDIVLTDEDKPVMLEFNVETYSMWLAQFTGVPAFSLYTDEILEYTRENIKNIEFWRKY